MIDSHCHLDHEPLSTEINEIIKRAKKIGIEKLLTISTTFNSFKKILEIIEIDPIIYGTFGIHPHESKSDIADKKTIINNMKSHKKIIGVAS